MVFPDQIALSANDVRNAVETLYGVWTFVFLICFAATLRWRWRAFRIAPLFALVSALATPALSQVATGQPFAFSGPSDGIAYLMTAFYPAVVFVLTAFIAVVLGLISRVLVRALQPATPSV